MAEKVTSMRLNEEDLEQFKSFAKDNGLNQQQAFNSLIALAELEKAKNILGDRAKSIDTFRDTINKALGMYVNALEENTTAEQTIREELSKELQTKDNTISNLYEQLQEVKANNETLKSDNKKLNDDINVFSDRSLELIDKYGTVEKQLQVSNRNNETLQEQLTEYKEYKDTNKQLEKELEQLKDNINSKDKNINDLNSNVKQLQDKINNDTEMLEFYKSNNTELKDNIKALEQQYKQQIQEVKEEHAKALQAQLKANTEQLKSKYDVEIAKKDLELQKLQNEIEQLKAKSHRTTTNTKTK